MIYNMTFSSLFLSGFMNIGRLLDPCAQSKQDSGPLRMFKFRQWKPQGNEHTTTIRSDIVQAGMVRVGAKHRRSP